MTTHELILRLRGLKATLGRDTELVSLVETIGDKFGESLKKLDAVLTSASQPDTHTHAQSLKAHINATLTIIKNLKLPKVFVEIEKTIEQLESINGVLYVPEGEGLGNLINALSSFQDDFEDLIKGYQPSQTLKLVSSAQALSSTLKVTVNLIDLVIAKLETSVEVKENEESLSVLFGSTDEYRDVISKLDALNALYSELCPLFGVSASEYPLRIIKVESGSLWIYVLGNAAVIGFIVWLLKKAAGYIYRNFTTEGKILSIPKQIEAADSILEFSKKLEEAGVDTKANREELQKTLVAATRKLNSLIVNQSAIEVNDEVISVGQAYEQKFLQETKRRLLEEGTPPVESATGEHTNE